GHLLRFKDDRTPDSIAKSLEAAFSMRERPTALVFTYTAQLLTCYSWMVSKGLRVPGDVSVVSLANDSWFEDLHPRLCFYRPDTQLMSRSIADRVLELVETGQVTKEDGHIRLEYVSGATIGPPRGQRG
ncbi:MAG TPA: substrate-binding domain-containing protein, partial [Candidatus Sulfotelmatobacter sp.]|nr:substrate-binding domain-containing protein [Candidatus Sulfotelmatobacter sp.]